MKCHDNEFSINPVNVGPIAGANIITNEHRPMIVPNFCGGKITMATLNMSGKINPVPIPWIIRPIKTTLNVEAIAEINAPTIKAASANKTMRCVLNFLVSRLDNGITIPITSIYPVTSHWIVPVSTWSAVIIRGSAMLSDVSENMPTNDPNMRPNNARSGCSSWTSEISSSLNSVSLIKLSSFHNIF